MSTVDICRARVTPFSLPALALLLSCLLPHTSVAQEIPPHELSPASQSVWITGALGYASPGTAFVTEAWFSTGTFVIGANFTQADRGGFEEVRGGIDHSKGFGAAALVAGVKLPAGPFRFIAAAGVASGGDNQQGVHPAYRVGAEWRITQSVALSASRLAITSGLTRPYAADAIGISLGDMH